VNEMAHWLAMIHLQDAGRGYSEAVNFTDPGDKTTERHGAGLRLGSINNDPLRPVIAVRNIGESATTVTATIPYSKQNGETGTISLPEVSLAPGEIKLLNTSNPQLRRNDFATAGLEIKYTGAPGSVIATASSVSRSGNQVFTLPMKDPKSGLSSTGGYPWFIDEKGSTVVFIKNTTETQQQFHLDIIFPGGQWGSNLRTLAPGQTFKLDVREIRDSQAKGSEGNTIPLEATRGHIYWSVFGTAEKVLIGRAQTVDLAGGMASTYECQVCTCPASFAGARLTPSSIVGFPGDTALFLAQQQNSNCHGTMSCWFNVPGGATFSSTNPSIATIDSGGSATCVAPGSTTLLASWTGTVYYTAGPSGCQTTFVNASPGASCDVQQPPPTVRISNVSFNPLMIPRTSGSTTLTVQISSTTDVPANTVVQVEAFQDTNLNGVTLAIAPLDGKNNATISSPGTVATTTFMITTPSTNTKSGNVTYQARILNVTSGNPAIMVQIGAAAGGGITPAPGLTVQ
jgi:hypothetical protein